MLIVSCPVDPFDYPLLGYSWRDKLFFDVRLPMGLRSAAMACQRVTNAVCFMLSRVGCNVLSYLDDFMGISVPRSAFDDYAFTGSLIQALGLHESSHKACPPSTRVTCLGVLFDTINFTMSVTPDRLLELQTDLLPTWITKKSATKTELQSLIGKLAFVSKCVRPGRLFLTRAFLILCVPCGVIIIGSSYRPNFARISAGGCGLLTFTMVSLLFPRNCGPRPIVFFQPTRV